MCLQNKMNTEKELPITNEMNYICFACTEYHIRKHIGHTNTHIQIDKSRYVKCVVLNLVQALFISILNFHLFDLLLNYIKMK